MNTETTNERQPAAPPLGLGSSEGLGHAAPKAVKWYAFDSAKGSRQKRPPERKLVLVRLQCDDKGQRDGVAVGYFRNAAGDKQSPYFVVPGLHTGLVLGWCDCLPEGFEWPNVRANRGP